MSIRKGTTIIAGNSSPLDWTGTLQEYNIALENGTIKENMVCYITDDTLYTDDIRPEIDRLDNVKANKDLSNLSEVGEKHFLNKSQITNCITEIPQRIKYNLVDGTLTILKGSVVIVPYGTEDLTAQYPKGATFINDNFRVYDTQFTDGKFFVWAELVGDIVTSTTSSGTLKRYITLNLTTNAFSSVIQTESGTATSTQSYANNYTGYYNTSTNLIGYTNNTTTIDYTNIRSFPFMSVVADGTYMYGSVEQVFQGMGYIGSTVWVDKGVKGLIPNGKNEDGTLRNIEYTTPKFITRTLTHTQANDELALNTSNATIARHPHYELRDDNYLYYTTGQKVQGLVVYGNCDATSGVVSNFQPKQSFRAIDYSDKSEVSGWGMPSSKHINLTLGASGTTYTAPANGWVCVRKLATKTNQYLALTSGNLQVVQNAVASDSTLSLVLPVRKGARFQVGYNLGGTTQAFNFIYAEGEV